MVFEEESSSHNDGLMKRRLDEGIRPKSVVATATVAAAIPNKHLAKNDNPNKHLAKKDNPKKDQTKKDHPKKDQTKKDQTKKDHPTTAFIRQSLYPPNYVLSRTQFTDDYATELYEKLRNEMIETKKGKDRMEDNVIDSNDDIVGRQEAIENIEDDVVNVASEETQDEVIVNHSSENDNDRKTQSNKKRKVLSPITNNQNKSRKKSSKKKKTKRKKQTKPPTAGYKFHVETSDAEDDFTYVIFPSILPKLMVVGAHRSIRDKFEKHCRPIMMKLIKGGFIRCPTGPSSAGIKRSEIPNTVYILYVLYKDSTKKEIEKIGITAQGLLRFTDEELTRVEILTSSGWLTPDFDKEMIIAMNVLVDEIVEDQSVPQELRQLFHVFRQRGGGELGLMKNLYYQMLEISSQLFFRVGVPAEAFTCDTDELKRRREVILDIVNYLLPKLLDEIGNRKVKESDKHATASWITGAIGKLSSQIVATLWVANNSSWDDAQPVPAFQNASGAEQIFTPPTSDASIRNGRRMISKTVRKGTEEFMMELMDINENLFKNRGLEKEYIKAGYKRFVNIYDKVKIYVHPKTKAVHFLHNPLGTLLDSRPFYEIVDILLRFQWGEAMRLLWIGMETGKTHFTMAELTAESDGTQASFSFESVVRFFHQDRRVGTAVGRDILTDDEVMACMQNSLGKITNNTVCPRARRQQKNLQKSDYYINTCAKNLCSWYKYDQSNSRWRIDQVEVFDTDSLKGLILTLNNHFLDYSLGSGLATDSVQQRWLNFLRLFDQSGLSRQLKTDIRIGYSTFIGDVEQDEEWEKKFQLLAQYKEEHGTTRVPAACTVLYNWVRSQRTRLGQSAIPFEASNRNRTDHRRRYRMKRLGSIGFFESRSLDYVDGQEIVHLSNVQSHDVLSGRGRAFQKHPGNRKLLQDIGLYKQRFDESPKGGKGPIIEEIIGIVTSNGGRFLKPLNKDFVNSTWWTKVPEEVAHKKVRMAFCRYNSR